MVTTLLSRALLRRQTTPWLRAKSHQSPQQMRPQSTKGGPHEGPSNANAPPKPEQEIPVPNTVPTIPLWQRLGPLTRLGESYGRAQRKRPYWTQFASALVIYLCADLSAQNMSGKDYSPERTVRSLIIGGISAIPSYRWFVFLSQNFNYASRAGSLAVKIVINQTCFTPVFNSYFFGMQVLLVGEGWEQVIDRIKRTVPTSIVNSCKLWPAVTAFSFTFVPMEYRSVFAGVFAVGWQTYLSYLNRQAEEAEAKMEVDHPKEQASVQERSHESAGALLKMKMEA